MIQISGTTVWLSAAVDLMQSECLSELQANASHWIPVEGSDPNNTAIRPPADIMDKICPGDCSGHGVCSPEGDILQHKTSAMS